MAGDLAHNMTVLAKHADQKNAHFSVMARVLIRQALLLKNAVAPMAHNVPDITYESLNHEFALFDAFSKSPGFKTRLREWFMGEDVAKIVMELEETESGQEEQSPPPFGGKYEDGGAPEEYPEGATVFGGDYATDAREEAAPEEGAGGDDVPEVSSEDSPPDGPEQQEDDAVLSEVRA